MSLKKIIRSDLSIYHMVDLSNLSFLKKRLLFLKAYFDIDFRAVFWFRIYSHLYSGLFKQIAILLYFRIKSKHSIDIHPTSIIGPGLRLMHGFNIAIGPDVEIGSCCKIFNGVTLGKARPDNTDILMPKVGNYCILGTGAKILGERFIQDCSIVGANHVTRRSRNGADENDPLVKDVYKDYVEKLERLDVHNVT